jgi:hypothetical protein
MRLEIASKKAIDYALMNFHYAKKIAPRASDNAYSVFNEKNEWCGVICYGMGANHSIGKPYNLNQGQCVELIRIALNGKQESTTKVIGISLKLLKKNNPLIKLVVSYADKGQNHNGIVYQASNWFYVGSSESSGTEYFINNEWRHAKAIKSNQKKIAKKRKSSGKHKYIYPLDKKLIPLCKSLSKPYPKKEINAQIG